MTTTPHRQDDAALRALPTWLLLVGFAAIFFGERLIGSGQARLISGLGALFILASIVLRFVRLGGAQGDRKVPERTLLALQAVGVVGLVLYVLQSDLLLVIGGTMIERSSPKLAGALSALWPVLVLSSILPTIFVEVAWSAVARAPRLELVRIRDAAMTGLGVTFALTFAFTITYVATQRDGKWDFSYFRTARPGESTRKIVQTLDAPVDVSIFYPPANEVAEEVDGYFEDLAKESPELHVVKYDNAIDISKAKELNVSANGLIVISRNGRKETLNVGIELESARSQLRNLDKEVQKRLLQVAKPGRTVYLTSGHGERGFDPTSDTDKRATLRDMREILQSQSYAVRTLGMAEGLGVDIPSDAAVVAIIGPTSELLPEEVSSLERYLDKGGRLFVALDADMRTDPTQPNGPPVLKDLLASLGLKFDTTPLANDQIFAQRSYQKSDHYNIATGGYSSHASMASLNKLGMRAPMILVGAGHLEEVKERPPGTTVDFTVRAQGQTFNDLNRNFVADPNETRKTWELAAAVKRKVEPPKDAATPDAAKTDASKTDIAKKDDKADAAKKDDKADAKKDDKADAKKDDKADAKKDDKKKDDKKKPSDEMRAIVYSDVDALTDGIIGNPGNAYFLLDGIRWLSGDDAITGEVSSEVDQPIQHTRKQDQIWFYACIFFVPALVLGAGVLATRRRRMGARSTTKTIKETA